MPPRDSSFCVPKAISRASTRGRGRGPASTVKQNSPQPNHETPQSQFVVVPRTGRHAACSMQQKHRAPCHAAKNDERALQVSNHSLETARSERWLKLSNVSQITILPLQMMDLCTTPPNETQMIYIRFLSTHQVNPSKLPFPSTPTQNVFATYCLCLPRP